MRTQTWRGTRATNSAISLAGTAVLVGLFGLQTITRRVAAVIFVVGGKGGYIGRDAHLAEDSDRAGGPIGD